jgi:hypothetical protein
MAIEAELKRKNASGELVAWQLNDDGTDPVRDDAVKAAVQAAQPRRLVDPQGNPISSANRLPVDIGGQIAIEELSVTFDSVVSVGNSRDLPLAADEVFVGQWEDVLNYSAINGAVAQFSTDGVNVTTFAFATIPANQGVYFSFPPQARYFRIVYTNGPSPQTVLMSQVCFLFNPPADPVQPHGGQITDLSLATTTRSTMNGRVYEGAATGLHVPVRVNTSGHISTRIENEVSAQVTNEVATTVTNEVLAQVTNVVATTVTNEVLAEITNVVSAQVTNDVAAHITNEVLIARGLVERMMAKAPATGYSLWLDTATTGYVYILEAPSAAGASDTGFRGLRITLDSSGNPAGKVQTNTGPTLTYNNRTTDGGWA